MKIICDCGAKYAFDASPEMVRNPIAFACPTCGVDLSPRINAEVRQQFGAVPTAPRTELAPATEIALPPPGAKPAPTVAPAAPPAPPRITINVPTAAAPAQPSAPPPVRITLPGAAPAIPVPPPVVAPQMIVPPPVASAAPAPVAPVPVPPAAPASVPPPPPQIPMPSDSPVVRLSRGGASAAAANTPDVVDARFCPKHPQERVTEQCRVCAKPICPKCMQLFGYVCSPRCKEKAELQGIDVPKFAGQRDEAERKQWNKVGLIAKLAALLIITLVGVWFWYAWFGSHPRTAFKVRFEDEPALAGSSAICPDGQMVFIHGGKLARYDIKAKKEIWLRHLVDKKKIEADANRELQEIYAANAKSGSEYRIQIPTLDKLINQLLKSAEESLQLRVYGNNIWVADGEKVRRYDWVTGEPKQEVEFSGRLSGGVLRGSNLEFKEQVDVARLSVTRFDLNSGKVSTDEIGDKPKVVEKTNNTAALLAAMAGKSGAKTPGNVRGMTPQQLAAAVANAPLAGKLASPATISVARRQQEALDEMDEMDAELSGRAGGAGMSAEDEDKFLFREHSTLIPTEKGFIQMTSQMTEKNITARSAAKAPPKKSALDGPVNAAATMDIANEMLNEMSRNAGADMVREDHSKYKVKIHLGGGSEIQDWEGEVVGEPEIYPQATVNVLAADKKIIVLDHQNKVKWEEKLNFPIAGGGGYYEMDEAEHRGLGPVVERGDTLYVYDQGVLSAFDLATGKARWRLPSVGITGMFFDDAGKIYLNTTTASPDKIKYSRQINVNDSTADVVLKLDPKSGKEIWKHSMGGQIAYLSGKYIYTLSYTPPRDDGDEMDENLAALGLDSKPYIRIRRISPRNGRVLWDYFEQRGAHDIQIRDNMFQLVMKREVQVLKYISF